MTTSDIAARILSGLTSAALVGFVATLIIRDRLRERGVAQSLLVADMRASDVAADTLARQQRLDRANDIGREVRGAFLAQMKDRPHLAAIRARQEAVVLDDDARVAEWLEAGS